MKLNTDVSQLVKRKKTVYPTKRSMNLYFKVDRTTAPATAALYILFVLAILLALSKVIVYDPWVEKSQLEQEALALEQETTARMEQLQSYDEVLEAYLRSIPTQEELALVDRMEILDLIDSTVRSAATVTDVSITEDKVLLAFSDVTLKEAAALVSQLEQSPLVSSVQVDTAVSEREDGNRAEDHVYLEVTQEDDAGL